MRETIIDKTYRVEMDNTSPPAIVFNSPLFYDLSNMKANRTSTYRIPVTSHNRNVTGRPDDVDSTFRFAGEYHVLDEYRDGLPIIRDAQAYLLQATPTYLELSVSWGVLKPVQELLKINLTELPGGYSLRWDANTTFNNFAERPDYGFMYLRSFDSTTAQADIDDANIQYHYPSVKVYWLLQQIAATTGLTFEFQDLAAIPLREAYIPLLTNKASPGADDDITNATYALFLTTGFKVPNFFPQTTFRVTQDPAGIFGGTGEGLTARLPVGSYKFRVRMRASLNSTAASRYRTIGWEIWVATRGEPAKYNRYGPTTVGQFDNTQEIDFEVTQGDGGSDGKARMGVYLTRNGRADLDWLGGNSGGITNLYLEFYTWSASGEVAFGGDFPIINNLPEMTALNFIKGIMFQNGLYVEPRGSSGLYFAKVDSAVATTSGINMYYTAEHLDNRLLTRKPKNIKYTYSDYAQVNTLSYAEDETVRINANGSINIDDLTLEQQKEMVRLPFAASDSMNGAAIVPIFSYVLDDSGQPTGEIEYNGDNIQPRIVQRGEFAGYLAGTFPEAYRFPFIINESYNVVRAVLGSPTVVAWDVSMTVNQLSQFDEKRIFYFQGSHWLILNGTVTNNVLSGTFIKLPILDLT